MHSLGRRACHQIPNLVVSGLRKVLIPKPDSSERFRRLGTHDFVRLPLEILACFWRGNRDRHYESFRTKLPNRSRGCQHRRAGRQPVIDENHDPPLNFNRTFARAIGTLAAFKLFLFPFNDSFKALLIDTQGPKKLLVQYAYSSTCDCAQCKLLVPGHAELPYQKYVKRSFQRLCNFERYRNPASRQGEHDYSGIPAKVAEFPSQSTTGIASVSEWQ